MTNNAVLADKGLPTKEAALGFLVEVWERMKAGHKTTTNGVSLDDAEERWSRYLQNVCLMSEDAVLAEYDKVRAGGPSL